MAEKFQSVRGMNDVLPGEVGVWQRVEGALRGVCRAYGYREIRMPVVEAAGLFTQSIGDASDIVQKEMYVFSDKGRGEEGEGQLLALRPEATASVVRAGNQHGLFHNQKQRLWYMGPMFRRERPQKGRYRQFHQFGVEAFGWEGAEIDAEVVCIGARIWRELGIGGLGLQINTLGSAESRGRYREALRGYFAGHKGRLDADSRRRLESNPLRILDSKVEETQEVVRGAPDIREFLDGEAQANFAGLCAALEAGGVGYAVNPRLVRGLDYYTGLVFEWVVEGELGAQNAVCAGGRYDDLVENRGGGACAGVGFAIGLERLVGLVGRGEEGVDALDAVVYAGEVEGGTGARGGRASVGLVGERLRDAGLSVISQYGDGSARKNRNRAAKSGARILIQVDEKSGVLVGERASVVSHLSGEAGLKKAARAPIKTADVNELINWCNQ